MHLPPILPRHCWEILSLSQSHWLSGRASTTRSITVVTSQELYCFSQVSGYTIWEAARENDIVTVQRMLAVGTDPNYITSVSRGFYVYNNPWHSSSSLLPCECEETGAKSREKKKEIKSSSLAPTRRAACIIIRKRLWAV